MMNFLRQAGASDDDVAAIGYRNACDLLRIGS
jgi:hypothetical protein